MSDLVNHFAHRGDLAHLALFLWASWSTALLIFSLRELTGAMRRFDDFVRELARFNERFGNSRFGNSDGKTEQRPARHSRAVRAEDGPGEDLPRVRRSSRAH
ncbi:hypothetical protein [Variibacter gotjawalensis]|uniref:hypothetical protein n=1 Tax=Variibacter gotjawalensis TaxID=1333996 RepID=UPI000BBAF2E6|nr:hypothetical protein [Variibacter gotjawalensis]NIK47074.1 hypothetical protein [Variibacter gotjawalensis]